MFQKLLVIFLLFLFTMDSSAEYFQNEIAGIAINLPPFWKTKASKNLVESSSKDNQVILRMTSTNAKTQDLRVKNALQKIDEVLDNVEYATPPKGTTRSLNGLQVTYVEGKGIHKKTKGASQWSVATATNKETIIISIIATEKGNTKHGEIISRIVQSLTKTE
jgi:hypothetical protein